MLTRIRNAVRIEKPLVDMPSSKLRKGIAQVLKDEGYIWDYEEIETRPCEDAPAPDEVRPQRRASDHQDRPDQQAGLPQIHRATRTLKPILGGMGIQILSTPKGVISDRRARSEKVGGEVLALIH